MIWHIILFLYLFAGLFMGYRIHKLKTLRFYKELEERVELMAEFYDQCEEECSILRKILISTSDDISLMLMYDKDTQHTLNKLSELKEQIDTKLKEIEHGPAKN